jgi:hypothetical protein
MEVNGRSSAGPRSRQINIRYFWIRDVSEENDICIVHYPTLQMLADFFTKPLRGNLFRTFRDVMLGIKHISTINNTPSVRPEERVNNEHLETLDVVNGALKNTQKTVIEKTSPVVVQNNHSAYVWMERVSPKFSEKRNVSSREKKILKNSLINKIYSRRSVKDKRYEKKRKVPVSNSLIRIHPV